MERSVERDRWNRWTLVTIVLLATWLTTTGMSRATEAVTGEPAAPTRPNVLLIMTDDQGYGDLGCHGNPMIKTPNLDKLYSESVRLTDFHVDPTCSPTRSALMTGRYSGRVGVWHTIMGRSLLASSETTMAEVFQGSGYATGIFGKWHLGDNAPCRPQDQGFTDVFVHGGGGVGQTPDYWGNDYFDDTYFRNGKPEPKNGYCTDVWFDAATDFIKEQNNAGRPFFCYIPTNAPHGPYLVPENFEALYKDDPNVPNAAFYGMITNIDENVGALMKFLDNQELTANTLVIFMTDNGSSAALKGEIGFNAGMRGLKGSPYDGGHRVPCFVRWPAGGIDGGRDVDQLAAHLDLLPTLIDLCGLGAPEGLAFDGTSLAGLLNGTLQDIRENRTLIVESQRIEFPEKGRQCAVMTDRWRLVNRRELFDIEADPGQETDVASSHPEVVAELLQAYETWWNDLSRTHDQYARIAFGSPAENPVRLTCHDWHESAPPWHQGMIKNGRIANGFWAVEVAEPGRFEI